MKVEPIPIIDSTSILPSCNSATFLQYAKPIPVLSSFWLEFKVLNTSNILLKCFFLIPIPLSEIDSSKSFCVSLINKVIMD